MRDMTYRGNTRLHGDNDHLMTLESLRSRGRSDRRSKYTTYVEVDFPAR